MPRFPESFDVFPFVARAPHLSCVFLLFYPGPVIAFCEREKVRDDRARTRNALTGSFRTWFQETGMEKESGSGGGGGGSDATTGVTSASEKLQADQANPLLDPTALFGGKFYSLFCIFQRRAYSTGASVSQIREMGKVYARLISRLFYRGQKVSEFSFYGSCPESVGEEIFRFGERVSLWESPELEFPDFELWNNIRYVSM